MRPPTRSADSNYLTRILSELVAHSLSWAFREPVKTDDVPDYYDVIKNPMGMFCRLSQYLLLPQSQLADLMTMQHKLDTNQYPTMEAFLADMQLIFDNCRLYNPENTIYSRNATKMEAFLKDLLAERPS
jgi:histone acetyltransferase